MAPSVAPNNATRFITQEAVLNLVKKICPTAYIKGDKIILPQLPEGHTEGDGYAIRITTTPSYIVED